LSSGVIGRTGYESAKSNARQSADHRFESIPAAALFDGEPFVVISPGYRRLPFGQVTVLGAKAKIINQTALVLVI